jgi:hypothetical protein
MAEESPVAVPDPARVQTPDGLAEALDALRRRQGLSFVGIERAAAKLRPPQFLPHATAHDMIRKGRPTRDNLVTLLAVCKVPPSDLGQWLAAWERAKTAAIGRPPGAIRITAAKPRLLGVHAAIQVAGVPDTTSPEYVLRDIDTAEFGTRAWLRTHANQGGFLLLIGGSSVGKTRSAFEALRAELPSWWLVHPDNAESFAALTRQECARTVIWLDEIQNYLGGEHGLTSGTLRAFLSTPNQTVIVGTITSDRYTTYSAPTDSGDSEHSRALDVLRLADIIVVAQEFSRLERKRAEKAASTDRRIHVALHTPGYGLTQTLAAAPQLVAYWQNAKTDQPYAWAVLSAAIDAGRLGVWTPLPTELLRVAAVGYCTDQQRAEAPVTWFEEALAYITRKLLGATATLIPASAGMSRIAGYRPAEYLLQHASTDRRYEPIPASLWDALLNHVHDPGDLARLAESAADRFLYGYAIPYYKKAVAKGDRVAARQLADLLVELGDLDGAIAQMGTAALGDYFQRASADGPLPLTSVGYVR